MTACRENRCSGAAEKEGGAKGLVALEGVGDGGMAELNRNHDLMKW